MRGRKGKQILQGDTQGAPGKTWTDAARANRVSLPACWPSKVASQGPPAQGRHTPPHQTTTANSDSQHTPTAVIAPFHPVHAPLHPPPPPPRARATSPQRTVCRRQRAQTAVASRSALSMASAAGRGGGARLPAPRRAPTRQPACQEGSPRPTAAGDRWNGEVKRPTTGGTGGKQGGKNTCAAVRPVGKRGGKSGKKKRRHDGRNTRGRVERKEGEEKKHEQKNKKQWRRARQRQ